MKTPRVVAIGGGKTFEETDIINREILRLTGKPRPKILFIGTASLDAVRYVASFCAYFARLGAQPSALPLVHEKLKPEDIRKAVLGSDAIYVGGGNTLKMMALWRRRGLDKILCEAAIKGVVLSGLSAGANCWFEYGHSDALNKHDGGTYPYVEVRGLGLLPGTCCPHFSGEPRRLKDFPLMLARTGRCGVAIDDRCALIAEDGIIRVVGEGGITIFARGETPVRFESGSRISRDEVFGGG